MDAYIPIYAQYYKDKNEIITKEIYYKDYPTSGPREIGMYVTIKDNSSSIKIIYFNSRIKMAASMVRNWANDNDIKTNFSTFKFTTDAKPEWWTYQPKDITIANNYQYEPQALSRYKEKGIGIIIRSGEIPITDTIGDKKNFTWELIPF
jgi:hypothetical protein